jgi:uncharacterized protein (DUF433 family)
VFPSHKGSANWPKSITRSSGPTPRIAGHRIRVQDIAIAHERLGWSADEIVNQFPTITLADVYAALAFYWDHRDDIEQAIRVEREYAEELRQVTPDPRQRKRRDLAAQ